MLGSGRKASMVKEAGMVWACDREEDVLVLN